MKRKNVRDFHIPAPIPKGRASCNTQPTKPRMILWSSGKPASFYPRNHSLMVVSSAHRSMLLDDTLANLEVMDAIRATIGLRSPFA